MMSELAEFVLAVTERGECQCGKCADRGTRADPVGHVVDMEFFKVALRQSVSGLPPTAEAFRAFTSSHKGEFVRVDPMDGEAHSYIELGGWIGDQQLALLYMALGVLLGVFTLESPGTMMPFMPTKDRLELAGLGMVQVRVTA